MKLTINDLYDLDHTIAREYLEQFVFPWEALAGIGDAIRALGATLPPEDFEHTAQDVWIARDATVYPTATILAPCIIGASLSSGVQILPGFSRLSMNAMVKRLMLFCIPKILRCLLLTRCNLPRSQKLLLTKIHAARLLS